MMEDDESALHKAYWKDGTISARQYVLGLDALRCAANCPHCEPPDTDIPYDEDGPWNDQPF